MHRAEHRVEDVAIKAGKAQSLLVDTVFPYAFGRFLSFLSLGSRYRHSVLLGDLGADRLETLMRKT
jgi:hypothetical protein